MIVIIDYDSGNLASLKRGLSLAGMETRVSGQIKDIDQASALVLPGVGAFGEAMRNLKDSGLIPAIKRHVANGKPLVGICLGMQLLYETSYEHGTHEGLGFLKGSVVPMDSPYPVPHMGWNKLIFTDASHPLFKYLNMPPYVYFVHSYVVSTPGDEVLASSDYGQSIPAIVKKDNIMAMQFHPEKSADVGHALLRALGEVIA